MNESFILFQHRLRRPLDGITGRGLAGRVTHLLAQACVEAKTREFRGEGCQILRSQKSRLAVFDCIANAGLIDANNRKSRSHAFDDGKRMDFCHRCGHECIAHGNIRRKFFV